MVDKADSDPYRFASPSLFTTPTHSRTNSNSQFPFGHVASNANGNGENTPGTSTPNPPGTPHNALTHGVSSPLARSSPAPKYEPHFLFAVYRDSTTPPDPDDELHEPELDAKGNVLGHDLPQGHRLRGASQPFVYFSMRGLINALTLLIIMLGVFMLFPGYFIYSAVTKHNYFSRGGALVGYVSFEDVGSVTIAVAGTSVLGIVSGTVGPVAAVTVTPITPSTTDGVDGTETDLGVPVVATSTDDSIPTTTDPATTPIITSPPDPAATSTDGSGDDDGDGGDDSTDGIDTTATPRRRRRMPRPTFIPSS